MEESLDGRDGGRGRLGVLSAQHPPAEPKGHTGRWLDASIAAVGLVALAIPMGLVALGIRLALGAPVMFYQKRIGKGGAPFFLIKFRTMREAYDAEGAPLPDEMRLVPFGRLLRRTRVDEVPGLVNVLQGDMSLVGPRPWVPETCARLGPLAVSRTRVRPGLTGWAQVNGNNRLSDDEKLRLDLWYIEHRTLRLDLAILLRTLTVVVAGERRHPTNIERARRHACSAGRHG